MTSDHFDRRSLLRGGLLASAATLTPVAWSVGAAWAQAPTVDSLQVFVPAAPGGGWDQTARTMEQVLKTAGLIRTAQITNVGGAGGAVGLPQFINQWKGRQNAIMIAGLVMVGALLSNKSAVKITQVTPVARLTGETEVIVVPAQSPIKDMAGLVAMLKADPGGVSWAGGSAGGIDHILVGLIAQAVGVDPKKTSYVAFAGGGPAQAALLGAQVTAGVSGWGEFSEQIKAGKLRALAISYAKRIPGIDVPTLKEQGVDVDIANWRGVFGPPGITPAQRQGLIDLVMRMNGTDAWKTELEKRDWTDILLTGDAFGAFIDSENTRVEGILRTLGMVS